MDVVGKLWALFVHKLEILVCIESRTHQCILHWVIMYALAHIRIVWQLQAYNLRTTTIFKTFSSVKKTYACLFNRGFYVGKNVINSGTWLDWSMHAVGIKWYFFSYMPYKYYWFYCVCIAYFSSRHLCDRCNFNCILHHNGNLLE